MQKRGQTLEPGSQTEPARRARWRGALFLLVFLLQVLQPVLAVEAIASASASGGITSAGLCTSGRADAPDRQHHQHDGLLCDSCFACRATPALLTEAASVPPPAWRFSPPPPPLRCTPARAPPDIRPRARAPPAFS